MTQGVNRQWSSPYRSRSGMILGVCKGLAEYFDFSLFGMRVLTCILLVFSGVWPIIVLYFLAAVLMKPEPVVPLKTEGEQEFYNSYASSRRMALHRLKRTYDNLDRRIQQIESIVTSREYDWERRLNE
ncbi:MAG: PspC domain-containing protein [Deltaproteobacteria bacterium]|nr:PspC domain-containing protein [Deltaproteobacteria bacterium]